MTDIPLYSTFTKIEPVNKGWSEDKKYCVTKADGTKYLLRVSPLSQYEQRKELFAIQERVAALNIPICKPVEFGTIKDGVYSLQSWIDGDDLEAVLPLQSESDQYVLGLKAGEILQKIHSLPVPKTDTDGIGSMEWIIRKYQVCGLHFDDEEKIIAYINNNKHLLINRPQCFLFSDYNVKNMMFEDGELKIIDFERYDIGDPWEEFKNIVWSAIASPHFATGQIRGYFGGEPPMEFFKFLAVYISGLLLSLLSSWAVTSEFGRNVTLKLSQDILRWFDNMKNPVPTWYLNSYELWDILEINGDKTGRVIKRGQPMYNGEYHLAVHVWIRNRNGEWLISKRSPEKKTSPNIWEACGGAAVAGEDSLTTALRETKEELGLTLDPDTGHLFTTVIHENQHPPGGSCMADIWTFLHDCHIEDIILQPGETCDAQWATADRIRSMMAKKEFLDNPYFDKMVEKSEASK